MNAVKVVALIGVLLIVAGLILPDVIVEDVRTGERNTESFFDVDSFDGATLQMGLADSYFALPLLIAAVMTAYLYVFRLDQKLLIRGMGVVMVALLINSYFFWQHVLFGQSNDIVSSSPGAGWLPMVLGVLMMLGASWLPEPIHDEEMITDDE